MIPVRLIGWKHPEISQNASDRQQDAQSDAEDGIPVFSQVTFHDFGLFLFVRMSVMDGTFPAGTTSSAKTKR